MDRTSSIGRRGLRSIILLLRWEVWKERNAAIFEHKETLNQVKIKDEVTLRVTGGAKHLFRLLQCFLFQFFFSSWHLTLPFGL
jgi:hypothetical protein